MRLPRECRVQDAFGSVIPFTALVGQAELQRVAEIAKRFSERYPIAESRVRERYAPLSELGRLVKYRRATGRFPSRVQSPEQYRLLSFTRAIVGMQQRGTDALRKSLQDRLRAEVEVAWRPLAFEVAVALDLMARGWDVEFSELTGTTTFDLMARKGSYEVPVECKTIRYDSGKAVSRESFEILCSLLQDAWLGHGSRCVHIVLRDRLEPGEGAAIALEKSLRPLIAGQGGLLPDGKGTVSVLKWTPIEPLSEDRLRGEIDRLVGTERHQAFLAGRDGEQVVVVATSTHRDRPVGVIYDRLRKETVKQLPTPGPCLAFVYLEEVDDMDWRCLQNGSALEAMAVHLLKNPARAHVHSLIFRSHGTVRLEGGIAGGEGRSLVFINANSGHLGVKDLDFRASNA